LSPDDATLPAATADSRLKARFPMAILVLGLIIFLGLHSTRIVAEGGREKAIARLGEGPWKGVYSLLSAIGFVLIVWGFAQARYSAPELWTPVPGARHITIALMLLSMVLLAAYLFKQSHITAWVHHPMVWSVAVFGLAHLIANGSAADAVLFGAFLVWAAADLVSSYARDRRDGVVYPEPNLSATIGAIVVGLVFWALLAFWLHYWLFGVTPLAR
jgi:uncharacterized membrane protein